MIFKFLICYGLVQTIIASHPSKYYYGVTPKDVEIFASVNPGQRAPDPPLPPWSEKKKPKTTTEQPSHHTWKPISPTFYPKKPSSSTKKPSSTTRVPPIYSWTSKKPLNFPSPLNPSFGTNNTPFSTTSQPPRASTTRGSTWPSTRWPVTPSKPQVFPSSTPGPTWQPKYPNTVGSGSKGTPPWIYPPRPSWPRPHHLMVAGVNSYVTEAVQVFAEDDSSLTGHLSEYQAYNEEDGSFKLGFELPNGISAKIHGYMKNGKLIVEGSYSIFTQDGKPVNIIHKADDNNDQDDEPTIFHLNIPPYDPSLDDETEDVDLFSTSMPDHFNRSEIFSVVESGNDDGQFSDFILHPTTQEESDDEVISVTESLS